MRFVAVLVLAFCVMLVTVSVVYTLVKSKETFPPGTQSMAYQFTIDSVPGVDTRRDIFRLGQVTPGGSSWRLLSIDAGLGSMTREEQGMRQVIVVARGDGAQWLLITPGLLTLPGDANISLRPSLDAPVGTYSGILHVVPYTK